MVHLGEYWSRVIIGETGRLQSQRKHGPMRPGQQGETMGSFGQGYKLVPEKCDWKCVLLLSERERKRQ